MPASSPQEPGLTGTVALGGSVDDHGPVRVAVVNDYALVVAGVARLLAAYPDRVRVIEVDSGAEVRAAVDVVLYDTFAQAEGAAIDTVALLARTTARLVAWTWHVDADMVRDALDAGASGVVAKSSPVETLVDALERVHAGEVVLPEAVGPGSGPSGDVAGRWPGREKGLSPREAEVLALICQGLGNAEVAERAVLGRNTVKTYVRTLYRKIGVANRAQAVLWGAEHGFLPDRTRRRLDP